MNVFYCTFIKFIVSLFFFQDFVYVTSFTSNTVTKLSKRTGEINLIIVVDDGIPVGAEIWDPSNKSPVSSMFFLTCNERKIEM